MDGNNGQQREPRMDADGRRYERQGQMQETPNDEVPNDQTAAISYRLSAVSYGRAGIRAIRVISGPRLLPCRSHQRYPCNQWFGVLLCRSAKRTLLRQGYGGQAPNGGCQLSAISSQLRKTPLQNELAVRRAGPIWRGIAALRNEPNLPELHANKGVTLTLRGRVAGRQGG